MLEDAVYYVQPINSEDSSLTSAHYLIAADSLQAPNASCGMYIYSLNKSKLICWHTVPLWETRGTRYDDVLVVEIGRMTSALIIDYHRNSVTLILIYVKKTAVYTHY